MPKRTKYAHLIDKLPPLPPEYEDAAVKDKVEARKHQVLSYLPREASAIAARFAELRHAKDDLKQQLAEIEIDLQAVEQLLLQQFEAEGTTSLKLVTGEAIRVQEEPQAQVFDKEIFRRWCIDEGLERSMHLAWGTTNSMAKDRLLANEGDPAIPGVKMYRNEKIVFTK